ncbi:MAG: nitrate reductase [Opitutales bacterium]|nr:nitrate reductase [Opitutales bacterium]
MNASEQTTVTETKTTRSVCPYCGVGCGILIHSQGDRVVKVTGDREHPVNEGRLCTKGATCGIPLHEEGRLTDFCQRSDRSASWERTKADTALNAVAAQFTAIRAQHGPDALSMYLSGQLSTEAQYVANKLCKGFWGTNNVDSNSRLCMASAATGYKQSFGADAPEASYADIDQADTFFIIGSNMADCHPILFQRVLRRKKESGAKIIVVDPRRTATADKADLYLQIAPGTDLSLLNGLLKALICRDKIDDRFVAECTEGLEGTIQAVASYTPALVSEQTGLNIDEQNQLVDLLAASKGWMTFWTMGLNQSTRGTAHTSAICNLHLLTGQIGKPGAGPFSLTGQPNAMGGREMGYLAAGLPGQRAVISAEDRTLCEEIWGVEPGTIQPKPGAAAIELFERMRAGEVKAVWVIGTNPVASMPRSGRVIEALQQAECVVVQDAFSPTETSEYADFLLPGALWAETDGTMVNSERRVTRMQQAISAPGDAMADWQIICEVAKRMGYEGFDFESAEEVFNEIQLFANLETGYDLRGMSFSRLKEKSLMWPCPDSHSDGVEKRYGCGTQMRFPTASGRAQFIPTPYIPDPRDAALGTLTLNTGRYPHQWHTLTKTGRVSQLNQLNEKALLEVNPFDAEQLQIESGDRVTVSNSDGEFRMQVDVTDRVSPGQCYAPIHWNQLHGDGSSVNVATPSEADPKSLQPALKSAGVSLAVMEVAHAAVSAASDYDDGYAMGQQSLSFFRQKRSLLAIVRPISRISTLKS